MTLNYIACGDNDPYVIWQVKIDAVFFGGVGLARGLKVVNFSVVFKIMLYWVLSFLQQH